MPRHDLSRNGNMVVHFLHGDRPARCDPPDYRHEPEPVVAVSGKVGERARLHQVIAEQRLHAHAEVGRHLLDGVVVARHVLALFPVSIRAQGNPELLSSFALRNAGSLSHVF